MKKIFVPEQFVATKWNTPKDKADFANHMIRFIDSGFKETLFNKKFYTRLSMMFGHIAHYDKFGFYDEWFHDELDQKRFILNIKTNWLVGVGDPNFTWSDVEKALQKYVKEHY